jgi:hypothetical protein
MKRPGSGRGRCLSAIAVFLSMAALGLELPADGTHYPTNIGPVTLEDTQWQFLPQLIRGVFVGPDGRIWYQLHHPTCDEDVATVRWIIEGQFDESTPQLFGAEPALFESNGRVWFRTHSRKWLLGYDGRDWLERPAGDGATFIGSCPRHGRVDRCDYNLEVDGSLFFPDEQGVHTFDGESWDYQAMGTTTYDTRIVVRTEPMGRGVIAINPADLSRIWHFRQGQWQEEPLAETGIQEVLPAWGGGVWLLTNNHALQFHAFGGDGGETPRLPPGRISDTGWPAQFHLLYCDSPTGRCFFIVERWVADGPIVQQDLLILNDGEEPVVVANYEGPRRWDALWMDDSGPILTPDGRSIWIPGAHDGKGCDKLDLATGLLTDSVPDPIFYWIQAVHPDGTVFISVEEPWWSTSTLAAYRPGAPMPTNTLDIWTYVLRPDPYYPAVCVDSAGDIWAALEDGALWRFDGTAWHATEGMAANEYVNMLLPGEAGRLIIGTNRACYYRAEATMTKHNSLRNAIAQNAVDIVANYRTVTPPARCYTNFLLSLAADGDGNIWLLESTGSSKKLNVFIDGQWLDARPALTAAGSVTGTVGYMNTVGGRREVYLCDFMLLHDGGRSFFARVEDGQIVLSDAPHCTDLDQIRLNIRDPSDALWIPGRVGYAADRCDVTYGQLALRAGPTGILQEFTDLGWAQLCDASGVVWMGKIWNEWATRFSLWRQGQICGQVAVPFDPQWLFSDAEGSVYIWTKGGLCHMTASASSGFSDYALSDYYVKPVLPGNILQFAYSENGFVVLRTRSDWAPRVSQVVLIPLPAPTR